MKLDNIEMIKVASLRTKIVSVPGEDTKTVTSVLIGRDVDGISYFIVPNRAKKKKQAQDQPDYFLFKAECMEPAELNKESAHNEPTYPVVAK